MDQSQSPKELYLSLVKAASLDNNTQEGKDKSEVKQHWHQ